MENDDSFNPHICDVCAEPSAVEFGCRCCCELCAECFLVHLHLDPANVRAPKCLYGGQAMTGEARRRAMKAVRGVKLPPEVLRRMGKA